MSKKCDLHKKWDCPNKACQSKQTYSRSRTNDFRCRRCGQTFSVDDKGRRIMPKNH